MPNDRKTIAGPGFTATVFGGSDCAGELTAGGRVRMRFGRTRCGGFDETGALLKKLRFHHSLDRLSASIEIASVIPFGCEYKVERCLEAMAGVAFWTVDVSAVTRGIVSAVELEPVTFPGPWKTLEYLVYGEEAFRRVELGDAETEFHCGRELIVSIRLAADDGARVEFNAGGDLWRHRAAMHNPGLDGEYLLAGNAAQLTFRRKVFAFPAGVAIDKRPWRFKNSFAWTLPGDRFAEPGEEAVLDFAASELPESALRIRGGGETEASACMTSAAARRLFRDFVRHGGEADLRMAGLTAGCCCAAAHLERPGKGELEHFDLDDCIGFYLWGNRQLAKKGHHLRITPAAEGPFAGSVSAAILERYPRVPLEEQETE